MAKFDLYANPDGPGYLVDCQSNLLDYLNSRFVVPLLPPDSAPKPAGRLNPIFQIEDAPYVMVTQFAGAVPQRRLGPTIASLASEDAAIGNAIDMLLFGF